MIEDAPWPYNLRYYHTAYGSGLWEEPVCFVFPDWSKPGIYHAQITHYGAVSANASDPAAGYELLRALQDEDTSDTTFNKYLADSLYEMPVSREVMDRTLSNLETQEGGYVMLGGARTLIEPMPDWYAEQIDTVLASLADAVLPDRAVGTILMDCLEPYYMLQDDFDTCYDELVDQLTLFLEEAPLLEADR